MANILLVDDHPAIRHTITGYLEAFGHEVTAVPRAHSALELAGPETDLVLTDLAAPDVDRVALIHALRARNVFAPVILVSEHLPQAEERAAAAFILLKPFAPDELGRAIEWVLGSRQHDVRVS